VKPPTKASNITLQTNLKVPTVPSTTVPLPSLHTKIEPKLEPQTNNGQIKNVPMPSSAPSNPFGRGASSATPTPPPPIAANAFNNSKPPTLTPNTPTTPSTEKKQMPSLTPSTPLAPLISPLSDSDGNGTGSAASLDSKDGKLSFGIVDDSLLSKSINTPKGVYFVLFFVFYAISRSQFIK